MNFHVVVPWLEVASVLSVWNVDEIQGNALCGFICRAIIIRNGLGKFLFGMQAIFKSVLTLTRK